MISDIQFGIEDYRAVYKEMNALAETVSYSLVKVTGYSSTTDSISGYTPGNTTDSTYGLIVADNGPALLILVKDNGLTSSNEVRATFFDGTSASGAILGKDSATGYLILSIYKTSLTASTQESAVPASLGSSRSTALKGSPIMALGSVTGIMDSMSYGIVTSSNLMLDMTDSDYTLVTTDIVSADSATGIIVNLRGYVIGIIDNSYESDACDSLLTAVGISELKPLIEKISNKTPRAYLGIHGTDISQEMMDAYNLPSGIYLTSIEMDSPAMEAGLQNGDILISVDGETPSTYYDLITWLESAEPGEEVVIEINRQSVDKYISLSLTVTLGSVEYTMEE